MMPVRRILDSLLDALRRTMGLSTLRHIQMVTRDGGRTNHAWQVDRNGKQIGPSRKSIHDSETIPNGLSAIPGRVSAFAVSSASSLVICSPDRNHCCSLLRFGRGMQIALVFIGWQQHPEREQLVREVFAREGIAPVHDARGEREAILHYPVPDSVQRTAFLCAEVLARGYGIAEDEPLLFTVIRYQ